MLLGLAQRQPLPWEEKGPRLRPVPLRSRHLKAPITAPWGPPKPHQHLRRDINQVIPPPGQASSWALLFWYQHPPVSGAPTPRTVPSLVDFWVHESDQLL